jgi:regulator of protease activity HflC (stomatin/prohibitin superfamily)
MDNTLTPQTKKMIIKSAAVLITVILLGIVGFGSIRTVGAGEVGIITRFGEVNRVAESGLTFKIPFIESMTKMETRIQKQEVKSDAATKDLQEVNGAVAVNYSITNDNALKIYKELGINYVDTVITPILTEAFKEGVTQYTAEQLMANRTEAKEYILENVKNRLETYGITVIDANLTDLNFSEEFNKAIEQKAVAQQEVEKAKQELERVKVEAESRVENAKAEAEAQRLQQQTLTDAMIKKMWIEKWDGKLPTTTTGDSGVMIDLGK